MKFKSFVLIAILAIFFSSCERDDICAESTPVTPLLVIDFFDIENPTEPKTPVNLTIREVDGDTLEGSPFNSSTISIPLRTNADQTNFLFILNTGSEELETPENTDGFSVNYVRIEEYISKACGFRITYDALDPNRTAETNGFWIQDIQVTNTTVDDETSTHIQIFH